MVTVWSSFPPWKDVLSYMNMGVLHVMMAMHYTVMGCAIRGLYMGVPNMLPLMGARSASINFLYLMDYVLPLGAK
jgi:hypothetical protein